MQTPSDRLQLLVADRLEHLAERVEWLLSIGDEASAMVLKTEGLMLAEAYDREDPFFAIDSAALLQ
jgi:hypothetical protein